ncbi:MAG TPA: hypothetical protein VI916_08510 [Acidimicrobiia bacterium]|nr:hypothetical protein [Acidimicrobiia bacterium]
MWALFSPSQLAEAEYWGSFRADGRRVRCASDGRGAGTTDLVIQRVDRLEGTSVSSPPCENRCFNAGRHAGATSVDVRLEAGNGEVVLREIDDGAGTVIGWRVPVSGRRE